MKALVPGLGLYSIGVRGLTVPGLLGWAALHRIPFVHLRGGRRGFNVAAVSDAVLDLWRGHIETSVPVTMVTAENTLDDLLNTRGETSLAARQQLIRTAEAARRLGAGSVRVLATSHPNLAEVNRAAPVDIGLPLLIELHDSGWWSPLGIDALSSLIASWPRVRLLADSGQANAAVTHLGNDTAPEAVAWVVSHADVLHLSDDGAGLDGPGHRLLAKHAQTALRISRPLEVAVEWTGPDRRPMTCLDRYQRASTWWSTIGVNTEAVP